MLPVFETELETFRYKIDSLKNSSSASGPRRMILKGVGVNLASQDNKWFAIDSLSKPFSDKEYHILSYAKELKELQGIQQNYSQQIKNGTEITFTSNKPVKLLVGYFKTQRTAFTRDTIFLKEPELETNASADDYGQAEIKISNAVAVTGMPPVNIHAFNFNAGSHQLKLAKGVCLILGFVDGDQIIPVYDAMLTSDNKNRNVDWLFE